MDEHFGTEAEAVGGVFTMSQTKWPEGTRKRLARAQNVAASRATALREAVDMYGPEAQLKAQAEFDEAIAEYRAAMLAMFELEDTAAAPHRLSMTTDPSAPQVEPGGCRWCGVDERSHASRFAEPVGQHVYAPPTSTQRLARMRARHTTRA